MLGLAATVTSNCDVTACLKIFKALYLKKLQRYLKSVNSSSERISSAYKKSSKKNFEIFLKVKNFKIKNKNLKILKYVVSNFFEIRICEICVRHNPETVEKIMGFG